MQHSSEYTGNPLPMVETVLEDELRRLIVDRWNAGEELEHTHTPSAHIGTATNLDLDAATNQDHCTTANREPCPTTNRNPFTTTNREPCTTTNPDSCTTTNPDSCTTLNWDLCTTTNTGSLYDYEAGLL